MLRTRVIPSLLLKDLGLVKTRKFKNPVYLGDPINIVKIFNDKEVDELAILDITATVENREPNWELLYDITSECFMPLAYGGGIKTTDQIQRLLRFGFEKVIINTAAQENPAIITEAAGLYGSQSIVVSIDVRKTLWGKYEVRTRSGTKKTGLSPMIWAQTMQEAGAGEILLNSVDQDGEMAGYDLELIESVASSVDVPIIACGGAGKTNDLVLAANSAGASAVAAGSLFVFQGPHRAVLINVPGKLDLEKAGLR